MPTPRTSLVLLLSSLLLAACEPYSGDVFPPESEVVRANLNTELPTSPPPDYNPWIETSEDNLATFSVDVDTASYTQARRDINAGRLPVPGKVRVEEFINFFRFDYTAPKTTDDHPFAIALEAAPSPFADNAQVLRVGIQAAEVPDDQRQHANLVFLVDVSGSMQSADKIGLVKYSLQTAVNYLSPTDTVAIVTYAGSDTVALQPTPASQRGVILEAIDNLSAGGGTAGADGLRSAYALAEQAFVAGAANRVILATDGDFNIGLEGEPLIQEVESWRDRGIFLSVLGYGDDAQSGGNFDDFFLEELTNRGNGNFAFIDTHNEARRVLGTHLTGTLQVVAKDVKIQVELNPEVVQRYRLIGYENRVLEDSDFDNDQIDAGDIGAGHFVTAYLELEMTEGVEPGPVRVIPGDILYEQAVENAESDFITVRVRYKKPDLAVSDLVERPFRVEQIRSDFAEASPDFRFGAAVIEFAEILRESPFVTGNTFPEVIAVAEDSLEQVYHEDREELINLARAAQQLWDSRVVANNTP